MNTETENITGPSETASTFVIIRWLIRELIGVTLVGVILFVSAGTMYWMMGWTLVAVTFIWVCANALVLVPRRSPLIAERLGPKKGAKTWDGMIMGIIGIATIGRLVVAGLDLRFDWSPVIPQPVQWIALLVVACGYGLAVWAMAINNYFSQIVRIQDERGHKVVTDGPYRWMRHPGYLGSILVEVGIPIMLDSWWALAVGGSVVLLFILRTALEDKTLKEELDGYSDYSQKVRYRVVPGIW